MDDKKDVVPATTLAEKPLPEPELNPVYERYRKIKTAFILTTFMGFGFACSIGAPAIPDLVNRLCVSFSQFSISISLGAIGGLCGSMLFGFIADRYQSRADLVLSITLSLMATMLVLKPFTPVLWLFIIWGMLEAGGYAGMDASCNSMIFGLWGEKANGPAHALHLVWGVGFTLGPFVVRPFLGSDAITDDDGAWNATMTTTPDYGNTTCVDDSRIEVPFCIAGAICYILSFCAFCFYMVGPPKGMVLFTREVKNLKQVINIKEIGGGDKKFAVIFLLLLALFYFGNAGREHVFGTWLFTYAVESDLKFTKQEAALLDAANKGSFMIGRIFAIPLAHYLPIQPLLFTEVYVVMGIVTCLATLGTQEKIYLWVFSCLMNFFSSPIWPGGISWADKYIPVTAIVITCMALGSTTAGFFFQWFTGWMFDNTSPDGVMYLLVAMSALICVVLVIWQVVASKHGNRYDRSRQAALDSAPEKQDNPYTREVTAGDPPPPYAETAPAGGAYENLAFASTYL